MNKYDFVSEKRIQCTYVYDKYFFFMPEMQAS